MVSDVINIGSSSKGNAYFLNIIKKNDYAFWDNNEESFGLLIECGFPFDVLSRRLREQSHGKFSMVNVKAVLITHRHGDHSLCVKELLDIGKTVYAPQEVFDTHGIDINDTKYRGYAIPLFENFRKLISPGISVIPFKLEHDEKKNMLNANKELLSKVIDYNENEYLINYGYIITIDKAYNILFFIDTMFMPFNLNGTGIKFNMIFGEANYFSTPIFFAYENAKEEMNYGNIKRYERLLYSHMSVETFIKTINGLDLTNCERIFVMHTSSSERVTGDEIKYYQYIKKNIKPYHRRDLKILVCKGDGNFATGSI